MVRVPLILIPSRNPQGSGEEIVMGYVSFADLGNFLCLRKDTQLWVIVVWLKKPGTCTVILAINLPDWPGMNKLTQNRCHYFYILSLEIHWILTVVLGSQI